MSKQKTHVAIVLDRSSSMSSTKSQTISGFNEQVDQIRENAKGQEVTISLVTFNGEVFEHLWLEDVDKIQHASDSDYTPSGSTAMRDGMGYTLDKLVKTTNPEDENTAYLVIVISDGDTNSDRHYNGSQLKEMVEGLQGSGKWTFTYMGCGKDVVERVARETGIHLSNCALWDNSNAHSTSKGYGASNKRMATYMRARASGQTASANFYNDQVNCLADFTEGDEDSGVAVSPPMDNASQIDLNEFKDAQPIPMPEVKVEEPVKLSDLYDRMRTGWAGSADVDMTYRPLSGSSGYFSQGNQVVMNHTNRPEQPQDFGNSYTPQSMWANAQNVDPGSRSYKNC